MLYSLSFLKQYLKDFSLESKGIRDLLTYSLAEVENVTELRSELNNILVGEVLDVKDHPKSNRLHIATVDV
jgi:phenylalanyl-tRNA synthetase beta chain